MKQRRRSKWRWFLGVILLLILEYAVWKHFHHTSAPKEATAQAETMRVTVVTPHQETVRQKVPATGMTVAREEALVQSELSNVRITHVFADAGEHVARGARLATLEDASLRLTWQQARADAAKAADEYHRYQSVAGTGAVSSQSIKEKETTLQATNARLADAALNLRHATITAPTSGTITERRASIGEMVSATTPLFRIAEGNKVEAELQVPEAMISQMHLRQKVVVTPSGSAAALEGTVRLITPRVDSANRSAMVRVALPSNAALPIGLFVNATITTGEVQGMVIPATALQRDATGTYVWQVGEDNIVKRLAVEIVFQQAETLVIKDIPPETRLIAKAGAFVKEGDKVAVMTENTP